MTVPKLDPPANGWAALIMRCPDCEHHPEPGCRTCAGSGWHPSSHTINEGLFINSDLVGKVEQFCGGGAVYANAVDARGEHERHVYRDREPAFEWCETYTGYRFSRRSISRGLS